jgi:hypothetical protein
VSHEFHEQIEHAAHAAHDSHGSRLPQFIGITVAMLGILMALCAAQVGEVRTELIATMVEEAAAKAKATAVGNKYRNLQAQLQQLHAAMPDVDYQKKKNEQIKTLDGKVKNEDTKLAVLIGKLDTLEILNTVTPTESDVKRFLGLIDRTREENEAAKQWSESYRDMVKVHENTASRFEIGVLTAEIGIVIGSVALLLSRQKLFAGGAWSIAIILGLVSMTVAIGTKVGNTQLLHGAEDKIHASEVRFENMNRDEEDIAEDKTLETDILKQMAELKKVIAESEVESAH